MTSSSTKTRVQKNTQSDSRLLRLLFDNTNMHAICMLTANGHIENWNKSAQQLLGYESHEVVGKNYAILFSKEDFQRRLPQKTLAAAAKKDNSDTESIRVRKDGTFFWANSFLTAVRNSRGAPTRFVLLIHDITEHRERARQKDEFLGIASHELKTPITTLSLYSELLAERLLLDNDKENLQMLRDIQSQSALLTTLIDDLLAINQIDAGQLQPAKKEFDIHAMVKKVVRGIQSTTTSHRIHCVGNVRDHVFADPDQIGRVLSNLIANAIKYSLRANKIIVRLQKKGGKIVLSVQDFGLGIDKKDQKAVFKRFYRAQGQRGGKIAGFGLGLYICSEIIHKHRQKIWVESTKRKGSTFYFTLPLA